MILFVLGLGVTSHAAIIKIGDVLDINVVDQPQFSGRFTVAATGTIDYPLLADETIVNITTSELMNHLTFRLAKHVDNPLVLISVVEKPEILVTVLGQVAKPGPIETYAGASLQEVLTAAGGPTELADVSRIKIVNEKSSDRSAIYYDLRSFLKEGNLDDMPRLNASDIVVVLARESSNQVKVIGGVRSPGFFKIEQPMSLFEAIYLAGGPAEKADLSRVRRFSTQGDKTIEEVVNVQGFIDDGQMGDIPQVNPGDVIIVYTRWFDWRTLLSILNNTLLFLVTIQAFGGVFN
jgi:protein involved in polysaccharide export with SLBB domain